MLAADLSTEQFRAISDLVYQKAGIHLKTGKEALVRARLMKRLRVLGLRSITDYMKLIGGDGGQDEINFMVDVMTTNKTSFFREAAHFEFLCDRVLPELDGESRVRFWSAACSSGEEPYTLAMVLKEAVSDLHRRDFLILATDISRRMLDVAGRGVYTPDKVKDVPGDLLHKYFERKRGAGGETYRVRRELRGLVRLAYLNLMQKWPMKGPFQAIFCRNVMIYFDRPTQQELVNRFHDLLAPGGYLFVGHSEGLSAIHHQFRYIKPAVYRKR
ncbi:MAG: CheR family methyltransferase [Desulfobacterales bacterium]